MKVRIESINEAKVKNVHDEQEGPKDNKHTVLSLPMELFVKMNEIDALYGCAEKQSIGDVYWIEDEMGNYLPRYKNIGSIQLKGVHGNGTLTIGSETYSNCRLTKAKFTPEQGDQAKLSCTISIINPTDEDGANILKLKGCSLPISFIGDKSLFEDTETNEDDEQQPSLLESNVQEVVDEPLNEAEEADLNEEIPEEAEEPEEVEDEAEEAEDYLEESA